jgi:hypothetical protein
MRDRLVRLVDEVVAAHHREYETALAAHHHEYDAGLTAGIERMIRALHEVEFRSRRDLWAAGEREAAVSRACPVDHGTGSRSQILIEAISMVPRNM